MKLSHIALAVVLTAIWGLNFVVIRLGLDHFPPLFFAVVRFTISGLPALVLPRPKMPFRQLALISATLFVMQYGFFFPGMQAGFPPGLASLTLQVQSFFTIVLAAMFLGERPSARSYIALAIAFGGIAVIASTVGTDGVTMAGFVLMLCSAFGWASGNVALKASPKTEIFGLIAWLSALSVLPLMALSLVFDGWRADVAAVLAIGWPSVGVLAYVTLLSTTVGFFIWGYLLRHYPAALVAPFTLLVPVSGTLSAALILEESFSSLRLIGMALVVVGMIANTFRVERLFRRA